MNTTIGNALAVINDYVNCAGVRPTSKSELLGLIKDIDLHTFLKDKEIDTILSNYSY